MKSESVNIERNLAPAYPMRLTSIPSHLSGKLTDPEIHEENVLIQLNRFHKLRSKSLETRLPYARRLANNLIPVKAYRLISRSWNDLAERTILGMIWDFLESHLTLCELNLSPGVRMTANRSDVQQHIARSIKIIIISYFLCSISHPLDLTS
jgi:hypothetical protein